MNDLTTEQQKAYDNLTGAVEEVLRLQGHESGLLGDYIVISAQHTFNDTGVIGYTNTYRNGSLPYHNILGLLRVATLNVENNFFGEEEE